MKRIKIILVVMAVAAIVFVVQNRMRHTYPTNVEQQLFENSHHSTHSVVPVSWYTTEGYMPPVVAGMLDGAYEMGVGIQQIVEFSGRYFTETPFRQQTNATAAQLWTQRNELYPLLQEQLAVYGNELAGQHGTTEAEYEFGKLLIMSASLFVGVGEISAGLKTARFPAKIGKTIRNVSKTKLLRIKANCVVCAQLFAGTSKLRKNLLQKNLQQTQALLKVEWEKSGRPWQQFIKDYEAHHIIPRDLLETSEALQFYYNNGGKLRFNSIENGIMVKKVNLGGVHANHPRYTAHLKYRLNEIFDEVNGLDIPLPEKINEFEFALKDLIATTRQEIIAKSIKQNTKINNLF